MTIEGLIAGYITRTARAPTRATARPECIPFTNLEHRPLLLELDATLPQANIIRDKLSSTANAFVKSICTSALSHDSTRHMIRARLEVK